MPFNPATGIYTPPNGAENAFPGEIIASATWNSIFTDLSNAMTQVGQQQITENPRIISTPGGTVTAGVADRVMLIQTPTGTIFLPPAATKLNPLTVIGNSGSIFGGFPAVLMPNGVETINGQASYTLNQIYQSVTLWPLTIGGWLIPSGYQPFRSGLWTPVFSFAVPGDLTVAYTEQYGVWQRVGNWVTLGCVLICTPTFSTGGPGPTGQPKITGLPYSSDDDYVAGLEYQNVGSLSAGYTQINAVTGGTSSLTIVFEAVGPGKSVSSITVPNVTSGAVTVFRFTMNYHTADQ